MSEQQQQTPLTYEGILELFRQADLRFQEQMQERMAQMTREADLRRQEADQRMQELKRQIEKTDRQLEKTDRQIERTSKEISSLGSRVGEIVENMIGGDIVGQFRELGYAVIILSRNMEFGEKGTNASGEIDLYLEDGDVAILIEVKTRPKADDVLDHIERLEKFRRCADTRGDKRRFIGAIAGASVEPEVVKFAHRKGMYVIVQAGRMVEIVSTPEGFQAKKW
ncbi:MAG: DUF724 domain-containing protein [Planctomycetaceae bacterium]|nr:DUF724 domain-containing protein [Planctomycetaceae bacterium]